MKLGDKVNVLHTEKGLNRDELGKMIGTSGAVIGRYERERILQVMDALLRDAQMSLTQQKLA